MRNKRFGQLAILVAVGMFVGMAEQTVWAWSFNNTYQMYFATTTWDHVLPTLDVQGNNIWIDGANRGYWRFTAGSGQYLMCDNHYDGYSYIRDSNIGNHGFYWIFCNPSSGTYGSINNGEGAICIYHMVIENGDRAYLSVWQGVLEWNRDNTIYALTSRCFKNDGTQINGQTQWLANIYSIYTSVMTIADGGGETYVGTIGGGTQIVKNGGGTQIFSNNNSYTGATTINGGTLQIGNGGNTGTFGSGNVACGATANINRNDSFDFNTLMGGSGSSTFGGSGTFQLTGSGTLTVNRTGLNPGTLAMYHNSAVLNLNAAVASTYVSIKHGTLNCNSTLTATSLKAGDYSNYSTSVININSGANVTLSSTLNRVSNGCGMMVGHWAATDYDHYGTLNIKGGTLSMTGDNIEISWDGGGIMNVSSGTVNVKGVFLVDHSGVNYRQFNLTGGTVNIGENGLRYVDSPQVSGSYPVYDKANNDKAASNNTSGKSWIKLGAGTLGTLAAWSSKANMELTDASTGVTFNTNGYDITLNGVLSGSGKLAKAGGNQLILNSVNTYSGGTNVRGGTLKLGTSGSVLGSGDLNFGADSAVVDLNGKSLSINGLTSSNNSLYNHGITNSTGTGTLTVGNSSGNEMYYGYITGNVAVTKTGSDMLRLAYDYAGRGKSTFTGDFTLAGGNIYVYYGKEMGSGTIRVTTAGTQIVNNGGAYSITTTESSRPVIDNNIVLSIGNANQMVIRAGWNNVGYAGLETSMTLRGNITGTGGIQYGVEATPGYLYLSGNNTYSGNTTIATGDIDAASRYAYWGFILDTNSAFGTGTVTVNRATRWEFNTSSAAHSLSNGSIVLNSDLMLMATNGAHTNRSDSTALIALTANCGESAGANAATISSAISGTGSVYAGKGTVIFTGSNTYTGNTNVAGGTLKINGSGTVGTTGNVIVNNGTFEVETSASMSISGKKWAVGTQANQTAVANIKSGTMTFVTGHEDIYVGGYGGLTSLLSNSTGTVNQSGGTINSCSWVTIGEWGTGIYNLSGGSVTSEYFCVGRRGTGTLNVSGTGSITTSNFVVGGDFGNTPAATNGTVNQTGGTVNTPSLVFGTSATQIDTGAASITTAIYNLSGGVLNLTGGFRAANGTHTHEMHISGTGQMALDTTTAISGLAFTMAGTGGGTGAVLFKQNTAINNNVTLTGDATVGVEDSITGTMSGVISGSGKALTKTGAGLLLLTATNTYDGGTTITGGTLKKGVAGAIVSNTTMAIGSGGTFDMNGFDQTLSMLTGYGSGAGTVTNTQAGTTSTLIVSNAALDTYAGMISESGSGKIHLVKQNTDKLEMKAAVAFSGGLDVNAGTLLFSGAANIDSNVNVTGNSTLIFTSSSVVNGTLNVTNGTLQMGNNTVGGQIGSGSVSLGSSGTLKFQYLLGRTFTNAVSGSGTIVQNSGGTISLSSNLDSFTGAVSVLKGTLNTTRAFTASTIDISGGTLKNSLVTLNASSTTISGGTLNLDGGGLVSDVTITSGTLKLNGGTLTGDVFVRGGNYSLKECTLNGDFIAYEGVALPILQSGVTINGTIYRGVDSVGSLSTSDAGGAFYFDEGTTLQLAMPSGSQAIEPEELSLVSFLEMTPASSELISVTSLKQLSTGDVVPMDDAVVLSKLKLNDGMTLDLTVNEQPTATESGWADLIATTEGIVGDVSAFDTLNLNFGATSASFSGDLSDFLQVNGNRLQINSLRVLDEYNTAVPEPSTWLLMALGVFGLTTYTRRHRARRA